MTGIFGRRAAMGVAVLAVTAVGLAGCGWRGLNSLPLPGTEGGGPGSFVIQAQVPDVNTIQPNSRVRVGDVNVGNVTPFMRGSVSASPVYSNGVIYTSLASASRGVYPRGGMFSEFGGPIMAIVEYAFFESSLIAHRQVV